MAGGSRPLGVRGGGEGGPSPPCRPMRRKEGDLLIFCLMVYIFVVLPFTLVSTLCVNRGWKRIHQQKKGQAGIRPGIYVQ